MKTVNKKFLLPFPVFFPIWLNKQSRCSHSVYVMISGWRGGRGWGILRTKGRHRTVAEFLDEIQTKVIRVFLLAIHSHLYSLALRFIFLQTHATSYVFLQFSYLLYTVKEKGGKPDRKPCPLPYCLRKSVQKPQVWEPSGGLCPDTSTKLHVHEFCFSTH